MKHTLIAVDLAKNVFEIGISTRPGAIAKRYRLTRSKMLPFFAKQSQATVVMEACGSAHDWARRLEAQGHRVVLLPPHVVRPYVQRSKTDRTDVEKLLHTLIAWCRGEHHVCSMAVFLADWLPRSIYCTISRFDFIPPCRTAVA